MDRIDSTNVAESLHGDGKHGFHGGNPQTGEKSTYLTPDWCNGLQEEVVRVIESAGITPSGENYEQLLAAIKYFAWGDKDAASSPISVFIRTLLDDVDAASARNTLGVASSSQSWLFSNSYYQFYPSWYTGTAEVWRLPNNLQIIKLENITKTVDGQIFNLPKAFSGSWQPMANDVGSGVHTISMHAHSASEVWVASKQGSNTVASTVFNMFAIGYCI